MVSDSLNAWRKFVTGGKNVRAIDLGVVEQLIPSLEFAGGALFDFAQGRSAPHDQVQHYFCCIAGVGLDVKVAKRANALPNGCDRMADIFSARRASSFASLHFP